MARDHELAGALLGSVLLHGSLLYVPVTPAGLAREAGPAQSWAFVVGSLASRPEGQAGSAVSEVRDAVALARSDQATHESIMSGTEVSPRPAVSFHPPPIPAVRPTDGLTDAMGTDRVALADLASAALPHYHRLSELTQRPVLQAPVLREEAGRLYPVSETLLSVRISDGGSVDSVVVLSAIEGALSAEAAAAFAGARYFPARIGRRAVRAELLIHVRSGPDSLTITPIER